MPLAPPARRVQHHLVVADEHVDPVAGVLQNLHGVGQVARRVLQADDVGDVGQILDDAAGQVGVHHLGNVVEDDGHLGQGSGDLVVVLVDALVRGMEEVGGDDQAGVAPASWALRASSMACLVPGAPVPAMTGLPWASSTAICTSRLFSSGVR